MARRSKAQLAETRQSLIDSAGVLFADRGFANTQIAEIAEHAGVGISTFYRQFDNKQQLLELVVKDLFDDLRAQLVEARARIGRQTPLEQLMATQRTYDIVFQTFHNRPNVALTMLRSGYGATFEVENLVWDSINGIVDDMVADMERAEQDGALTAIDRKRDFADALIGMVIQLSHRMLVEGRPGPVEAAQFCTRMTVGAMLTFMPPDKLANVTSLMASLDW
jgi:AcrR family transcriptional regulator